MLDEKNTQRYFRLSKKNHSHISDSNLQIDDSHKRTLPISKASRVTLTDLIILKRISTIASRRKQLVHK